MHNGISSFLSWSDKDESYLQKREENEKKKKKVQFPTLISISIPSKELKF